MTTPQIIMIVLLSILLIFAIAILWTLAASSSNKKKCPNPTKFIYEQQMKCALSKSKPFVLFSTQKNNQILVVNPNMSQGSLGVESMSIADFRNLLKGTSQSSNYYFVLSPTSTKNKYFVSVDQGINAGSVLSNQTNGSIELDSGGSGTEFSIKGIDNVQFLNCSLSGQVKLSSESKQLEISGKEVKITSKGQIHLATV